MKTSQKNAPQEKGPFAAFIDYILEKLSNGFTDIIKHCIKCSGNSRLNDKNIRNVMVAHEKKTHSSNSTLFSSGGFGAMEMDSDNAANFSQSLALNSNNFSSTQTITPVQITENTDQYLNDGKEKFLANSINHQINSPISEASIADIQTTTQTPYSADTSTTDLNDLDIIEISTPSSQSSVNSTVSSMNLFNDSDYIEINGNSSDDEENNLQIIKNT